MFADMPSQSVVNSRLGWVENGRFLEQFRYTIIASQLLNEVPNPGIYKRQNSLQGVDEAFPSVDPGEHRDVYSLIGLLATTLAAFALTWSIHWVRNVATSTPQAWPLVLALAIAIVVSSILYMYFRRHWLHWIRTQAVESASAMVTAARNCDAAVSASINLVQEVELVHRGYRM